MNPIESQPPVIEEGTQLATWLNDTGERSSKNSPGNDVLFHLIIWVNYNELTTSSLRAHWKS